MGDADMLGSYAQGRWYTAPDDGVELRNAVTGEPVARISSTGLDMAGMLDHGRRVGGPALRALTFHQRAMLCKALAAYLHERRDEFHALSLATGATRHDAGFDIDGGIITTRVISSKARQQLPNDTVYRDGAPERLSRRGTFVGQHVYTPLRGVVVQINAFNFPVWGMLEKLAPAVVAGVPTIVKPASQTAYLTELVVRRIIESGILPEGALQLICGSTGDLFDHLTGRDMVAFTGSAATATTLAGHPTVLAEAVRFNAERDSLNCAILGADAKPGTAEFDLYVDEVVSEITAKAGQRCTAIRRVIAPREHADAVAGTLRERLAKLRIGDPADPATDMGALASHGQRDEVRDAVARLADVSELVTGDGAGFAVHGADAEAGAFLPPQVLYADDPTAPPLHTVEAFGPVCAVLPYGGTDEAIELARMGDGSLVGSLFTYDPSIARDIVLGVAADHGRLHLVNRDCADEQTGHGSPLPHMVHGGPGRAGGGEELGGVRAVLHCMQRTAVQGPPDLVTAAVGAWMPGAGRNVTDDHPMARYLEDLAVGDTFVSEPRTITTDDVEHFAEFTGDRFYAHLDDAALAHHPFFERRVAHGYLVLSFAAGLFVYTDPGPLLANQGLTELRFGAPVYLGDTISVALTCKTISPREDQPYGEVRWDAMVINDDGVEVANYELITAVATRAAGDRPHDGAGGAR
ncbi:MAG: phenylacetic acid degradation bifunctional protein PaaZ [Actinobacteria bacterium]|nr:phenylacetic acid degradation bifunctional protein PaaZ [Actinomycetota bacterium]